MTKRGLRRLGALALAIAAAAPLAAATRGPGTSMPPQGPAETVVTAIAPPTPTAAPQPTVGAAQPTPEPTPTPTPDSPDPTPPPVGEDDVAALLADTVAAARFSIPNVEVSVTVSFDGLTITESTGLDTVISASLAKTYWVVAGVAAAGTDAVEPHVEAIFAFSDNDAAGRVIDLVGIDGVNAYTRSLGMADTFLSGWVYGIQRYSSERAKFGEENLTSTEDAVTLLAGLAAGELLGPEETFAVLQWMRLAPDRATPDIEWGAVLVEDLPLDVAARTAHKAGWLPPGCCTDIVNTLVAAGIVPLPGGRTFTIAVATMDGDDFDRQAAWISSTVAAVHELLGS